LKVAPKNLGRTEKTKGHHGIFSNGERKQQKGRKNSASGGLSWEVIGFNYREKRGTCEKRRKARSTRSELVELTA